MTVPRSHFRRCVANATIAIISAFPVHARAADVEITDVHRSYDLFAVAYSQIEYADSEAANGESVDLGEWDVSSSVESETIFNYYSWCQTSILAASHVSSTAANFYGWTRFEFLGCWVCGAHGTSFFRGSFDFDVTAPTRFELTGAIDGQYATAQLEEQGGEVLFSELLQWGSSQWERNVLLDPGSYTFAFVAAAGDTTMGTGIGEWLVQTTFDVHVDYSDPATPVGEAIESKTWSGTKALFR